MSLKCCECGLQIVRQGKRGPAPKRCPACHARNRRQCSRRRHSSRKKKYAKHCEECGKDFHTDRRQQKTCCPACRAKLKRSRFQIQCANEQCKKIFDVTPSRYAKGTRCCSDQCKHEHARGRGPERFCHYPACGKKIERENNGPRHAARGQDSMKYCCPECYADHRWGANRPKQKRSRKTLALASASALQTSLRKKCKLLGVPNDEECTRRAVLERDGWICQRCRIECNREYIIDPQTRRPDPRNAEHDHIVPLTAKGSPGNVFPNSQCLCRKCNNKKSDRSWGQLRLDLEGSVKRWENGARGRRQHSSKSLEATPAAAL